MRLDLRLAQGGEIFGYGLFVVESEMPGIGANESFIKDAAGKLIEVFVFDGFEHARADLGDVGNVIEREATPLCETFLRRFPRRLRGRNDFSPHVHEIIIGQA